MLPTELDELTSSLRLEPHHAKLLGRLSAFVHDVGNNVKMALSEGIDRIDAHVASYTQRTRQSLDDGQIRLTALEERCSRLGAATAVLEQKRESGRHELEAIQQRWARLWRDTCTDLSNGRAPVPEMSRSHLRARQTEYGDWLERQRAMRAKDERWRHLLEEWVRRLADPAASQREALRTLYAKHANVVGIT